jgi:hypothetical protein
MLLIVGREDTGELEAQVRGSRHAWDMRLISIDSLVHLVRLKESTEEAITGSKIRSVLVPMEYTRLDGLIDVMFTAAKDVESAVDSEQPTEDEDTQRSGWEFTDRTIMQEKRAVIINTFAQERDFKLIRRSGALYWNPDHSFRIVCTVSKRYSDRSTTPYWYAYHPRWDAFLEPAKQAFFILGCMDLNVAFAIPLDVIRERLDELNTTVKADGRTYWHIKIMETQQGGYSLHAPKSGNHLSLDQYSFPI